MVCGVLLIIVSFGVFSLLHIAPGSPVELMLGQGATPQAVHALNQEYHLNDPFFTQYWLWAKKAFQLQFGNSIQTTLPVTSEIKARLPMSLFLGC